MGFIDPAKINSRIQFSVNNQPSTCQFQTVTLNNIRIDRQCSLNDESNKTSKLTLKSVETGASIGMLKKTVSNK